VRSFLPTSYFASMGLTQYNQPAAIQIAWLLGVGGVSLLVVTVNCALALAIVNVKNLNRVKVQLAVDVVIIAALMGLNIFLLKQPLDETGSVRVAAVQFGYVPEATTHPAKLKRWVALQNRKDWPGMTRETIKLLEPMTRKAARDGAKLIVWPETMLSVSPFRFPTIRDSLSKLADNTNVFLVTPYYEVLPGHEKEEIPPYKNMAAVFAPNGALIHLYHKQQYVRMAGIEKGPGGHKTEALDTDIGRLALMICYDADYPNIPALFARRGGQVFIEPSHDLALFLTRHHPAMQLFRTVENHRALVKSDYVQGTLIVDPKGRILADPPDGLQIVSARVPLVSSPTIQPVPQYVFGGACAALFVVLSIVAARKRRA
jgi:apolipoprotein N-acyltransferase